MSTITISKGVTSTGLTVSSGVTLDVLSGGTASATVVDGGSEYVSGGGVDRSATLTSGGVEYVLAGGTANGDLVSGAFVGGVVVSGAQYVSSGGVATNTQLTSGGAQYVAGTASATTLLISGAQYVQQGGMASGATVGNFASQTISAGGVASAAIVSSGGQQFVLSDGIARATRLVGGTELVSSGGVASGTAVSGGGTQSAMSGASVSAATVTSGGYQYVDSGGTAYGTVVSSGGSATVTSGGTAFDLVVAGGTAILGDGAAATGSISFQGTGGALQLVDTVTPTVTISGFARGDQIDFNAVPYVSGGTVTTSGNTVVVSVGGTTYDLTVANGGAQSYTILDNQNSVELVVACFAKGTPIATERGERAVEAIAAGELVMTVSGQSRRVVWVGQRTVDCLTHPEPESVRPVRVRAHAFGSGVPRVDVLLSPDHALFVDGALIPVRHLIDGASIVRTGIRRVRYVHIELERHDVLLAAGLPAESFLDTGGRSSFEGGRVIDVHPNFSPRVWEAEGCAPLVVSGPEVDRARSRLRNAHAIAKRRARKVV